jgi:hypothetical protein
VTPDEFGDAWHQTKVDLPLDVPLNGALFGRPNEMFDADGASVFGAIDQAVQRYEAE